MSVTQVMIKSIRDEERAATEREIVYWLRTPMDDGGDWYRIYRDLAAAIERGEYRSK